MWSGKMGIRSLIYFQEVCEGKILTYVVIYQQSDGGPDIVGLILANFLKGITIVNGITYPRSGQKEANGFGCLISQYIAQEKKDIGGFYVADTESSGVEDWKYRVMYDRTKEEPISIIVNDCDNNDNDDNDDNDNDDNYNDEEKELLIHEGKKLSIDEFQKYCCKCARIDVEDAIMKEKELQDMLKMFIKLKNGYKYPKA